MVLASSNREPISPGLGLPKRAGQVAGMMRFWGSVFKDRLDGYPYSHGRFPNSETTTEADDPQELPTPRLTGKACRAAYPDLK